MNFRSLSAACAALLVATLANAHDYSVGDLKIGHPWARPTVKGQAAGGGFLTVNNAGAAADKLVGGSTPAAERLELHTMSMDGDVMRMRQVDTMEVNPGQTLELKPGGYHLMLMGLKAPLKAGDKVPAVLKFEKAGEVKVEFVVGEPPKGQAAKPAGHDHGHSGH